MNHSSMPIPWFDGHLDLAYVAQHGRDLALPPDRCGGTLQPASVTFPTLASANVRAAYSTLFVRRKTDSVSGDFCFQTPQEAFDAAWRQVELHKAWQRAGHIQWAGGATPASPSPLNVTLAMEGAACLRTVEDIDAFHAAGVRMVALAWAEGSPYAGGDQSGGDLTAEGVRLVARLDTLGMIHDVSHLSERAFWSLLDHAKGRVVASHSNCRTLLPDAKNPERHLSDAQIKAIAARNGTIGINFFSRFLIPAAELPHRRPTIADILKHIRHIESVAERRDLIALGSDMDSGFGTNLLPADLQSPQDLPRLAEALSRAGWSDTEIARFAWGW